MHNSIHNTSVNAINLRLKQLFKKKIQQVPTSTMCNLLHVSMVGMAPWPRCKHNWGDLGSPSPSCVRIACLVLGTGSTMGAPALNNLHPLVIRP